jgi:hypothetical protein
MIKYDSKTGLFFRETKPEKGWFPGYKNKAGYLCLYLKGKVVYAHRLAWFLMVGEWPPHTMDHIDRDKTNNKWENLRCVTRSINSLHRPGIGASLHKASGLWRARVSVKCVEILVGYFKTKEEAMLKAKEYKEGVLEQYPAGYKASQEDAMG